MSLTIRKFDIDPELSDKISNDKVTADDISERIKRRKIKDKPKK
jgi:hypothetical protein